MTVRRIPTGVTGLDKILHGGFIPASSYLLVGGPGAGKTILSLQFLRQCQQGKNRCLFLSLTESVATIRRDAASFGWQLRGINLVDMTLSDGEPKTNGEYSVFSPGEVEEESIWKKIHAAIEEYEPDRLVIDSVTNLRYLSTDEYQYRKHIQQLINHLSRRQCLSLLLFEPGELEREQSIAMAVDGIMWLHSDISKEKVVEIRTLEVSKFRGSSYLSGRHPMRITDHGIVIFPHCVEILHRPACPREYLSTGIQTLDELLSGGFHMGTCTLLTGPSGTGKSSLATHFLVQAALNGIKGSMYCFEEGRESILDRCQGIGIDLGSCLKAGKVSLVEVNPLELYPDEFLEIIRGDVEEKGCQIIVIDSLRGYQLAMDEYGNVAANIQNILNYLRRQQASLFLLNEMQYIMGDLRVSEDGVSYLADNVLMLRYAEYSGEIIKVIACLKKRHGNFQSDLREFKITERGILVGEKLTRLRGLLTGVPQVEDLGAKPEL
ncbi:ATPase domain-containing protein [Desulfolithobacter sp.]